MYHMYFLDNNEGSKDKVHYNIMDFYLVTYLSEAFAGDRI